MNESGNTRWYSVWSGPRVDGSFETKVGAKKHAAWLDFTYGHTTWWFKKVSVTGPDGEGIPFDDYEFRNGDSRRVRKRSGGRRRAAECRGSKPDRSFPARE